MFKELDLMLPEEALDGPLQMALDEVLLRSVNRATLRVYLWESPWVTFGYFQDSEEVRRTYPAFPIVRRWTGGGMVEHGRDFTFSLVVPKENPAATLPPARFYSELHRLVSTWLTTLLSTKDCIVLAGEKDQRKGGACFTAPACDDLLLNEQKILGGAQRRSDGGLLYQGSLQYLDTTRLNPGDLAAVLSPDVTISALTAQLRKEAEKVATSRYRSLQWHERRSCASAPVYPCEPKYVTGL